jgi:hypothetical protein
MAARLFGHGFWQHGYELLLYSWGDIPTRCLNNRVKCCGYLYPSSKAISLIDLLRSSSFPEKHSIGM